jgi:hypothetical protein
MTNGRGIAQCAANAHQAQGTLASSMDSRSKTGTALGENGREAVDDADLQP